MSYYINNNGVGIPPTTPRSPAPTSRSLSPSSTAYSHASYSHHHGGGGGGVMSRSVSPSTAATVSPHTVANAVVVGGGGGGGGGGSDNGPMIVADSDDTKKLNAQRLAINLVPQFLSPMTTSPTLSFKASPMLTSLFTNSSGGSTTTSAANGGASGSASSRIFSRALLKRQHHGGGGGGNVPAPRIITISLDSCVALAGYIAVIVIFLALLTNVFPHDAVDMDALSVVIDDGTDIYEEEGEGEGILHHRAPAGGGGGRGDKGEDASSSLVVGPPSESNYYKSKADALVNKILSVHDAASKALRKRLHISGGKEADGSGPHKKDHNQPHHPNTHHLHHGADAAEDDYHRGDGLLKRHMHALLDGVAGRDVLVEALSRRAQQKLHLKQKLRHKLLGGGVGGGGARRGGGGGLDGGSAPNMERFAGDASIEERNKLYRAEQRRQYLARGADAAADPAAAGVEANKPVDVAALALPAVGGEGADGTTGGTAGLGASVGAAAAGGGGGGVAASPYDDEEAYYESLSEEDLSEEDEDVALANGDGSGGVGRAGEPDRRSLSYLSHSLVERRVLDDDATFYAAIAQFRDVLCPHTLMELFGKARNPRRIFAGIVDQRWNNSLIDPNGIGAPQPRPNMTVGSTGFNLDGTCNPWYMMRKCAMTEFCPTDNIRVRRPYPTEGKGPTWGRYYGMLMYQGEKYYLMIDSHSRFVPHWDAQSVLNLLLLPKGNPKTVLSHYPGAYESYDALVSQRRDAFTMVMCNGHFKTFGIVRMDSEGIWIKGLPTPQQFSAGGYVFGNAQFVHEVPFDPYLTFLFDGEEVLYSVRLWTHGYDLFTPKNNILFHNYARHNAPRFWTLKELTGKYAGQMAHAQQRVQYLMKSLKNGTNVRMVSDVDAKRLNVDRDEHLYGLGKARSLDDYYKFAGVNTVNWTVSKQTCHDIQAGKRGARTKYHSVYRSDNEINAQILFK